MLELEVGMIATQSQKTIFSVYLAFWEDKRKPFNYLLCKTPNRVCMKRDKKPLYRKVNTKARGVHHLFGGDYSDTRNKESAVGMRQGIQRGLDYTPLFRFLLSSVGKNWNDVYSEAVSRLDKPEPIFWLVAMGKSGGKDSVLVGESSYYSGLYVDDSGLLQIVNPKVNETTLEPSCSCCTHTFNGVVFTKKYKP